MLAALALSGCGTPPAKDFGGSWKPINRFQDAPSEIPLAQPYAFYASPMDGTLKTMLTRWSKDSGMVLSYQLHSDFTLFKPVAQIHTPNAKAAAAELSAIYASEGVQISVSDRQIIVEAAPTTVAEPAASNTDAAPSSNDPAPPKPDAATSSKS